MSAKASCVGKQVGYLAVGGAIGYAAMLAIMAAIVIGLSHFMPAWLAALLVGAVVGAASFFLISSAIERLKNTNLKPEESVESIKEDAQWLKNQMS